MITGKVINERLTIALGALGNISLMMISKGVLPAICVRRSLLLKNWCSEL